MAGKGAYSWRSHAGRSAGLFRIPPGMKEALWGKLGRGARGRSLLGWRGPVLFIATENPYGRSKERVLRPCCAISAFRRPSLIAQRKYDTLVDKKTCGAAQGLKKPRANCDGWRPGEILAMGRNGFLGPGQGNSSSRRPHFPRCKLAKGNSRATPNRPRCRALAKKLRTRFDAMLAHWMIPPTLCTSDDSQTIHRNHHAAQGYRAVIPGCPPRTLC